MSSIYKQPTWCNYLKALYGPCGCWFLIGRNKISRESCKHCDNYFENNEFSETI